MTTHVRTAFPGGALSVRMAAVTAAAVVLATSGGLAAAQAAPAASPPTNVGSNELGTVVVTGGSGATVAQVSAQVRAAGGTVSAELPLIDGVVAQLPAGTALPGLRVTADAPLKVASDPAAPDTPGTVSTVRASLGLPAQGNEGAGVTVALVDTGVAEAPTWRAGLSITSTSRAAATATATGTARSSPD